MIKNKAFLLFVVFSIFLAACASTTASNIAQPAATAEPATESNVSPSTDSDCIADLPHCGYRPGQVL